MPPAAAGQDASLRPTTLRVEYRTDPLGLDVERPRLSWQLAPTDSSARGQHQTAYRVLVATSEDTLRPGAADLWDSGRPARDAAGVTFLRTEADAAVYRLEAGHYRFVVSDFERPRYSSN